MADIQLSLFGKMFPEPSPQTKAKTSEQSSRNSSKLKIVTPLFLDLRKENGLMPERSWETGIASVGESSTLSFGAYPRDVEESFLSQILEVNAPEKYYLSVKACQGILRRAEERGKELPPLLKTALEQQIARLSASAKDADVMGGKGCLVQTEQTGALATSNDQFVVASAYDGYNGSVSAEMSTLGVNCGMSTGRNGVIALDNHPQDSRVKISEDGTRPTLASKMGTGGNNVPLLMTYGICSKDSNAMKSDNPRSGFYEASSARTLDANGGNPSCNQGGMVVIEGNGQRPSHRGDGYSESKTEYTLNSTEVHGVAYGLGRDSFNMGQNAKFGMSIDEEVQPPMTAKGPGGRAHQDLERGYIVRRLTPTECARLQGMPDWWCSDVPHADSAEYKMWGNGMALPNVLYVMEGIAERMKEE